MANNGMRDVEQDGEYTFNVMLTSANYMRLSDGAYWTTEKLKIRDSFIILQFYLAEMFSCESLRCNCNGTL